MGIDWNAPDYGAGALADAGVEFDRRCEAIRMDGDEVAELIENELVANGDAGMDTLGELVARYHYFDKDDCARNVEVFAQLQDWFKSLSASVNQEIERTVAGDMP